MVVINGKGVYGGIVFGKLSFFQRKDVSVRRTKIEDKEAEKKRFEKAKERTIEQLQALYDKALKEVGETNAQIFEIHQMMVEDDDYNESVNSIIDSQSVNAEYAVAVTADNFAEMFGSMEDEYMKARAADVRDISNRIIGNFRDDSGELNTADEKTIICSDDLAPSETVQLDKSKVLAFVTTGGSANSHTAILARTMNIPAVIGVSELTEEYSGKNAIVDGYTGTIYIEPDEKTNEEMKKKQEEDIKKK